MAEVMGHIRRLLGVETPWHMVVDGEDQRLMLTFDDSEDIEYDQILGQHHDHQPRPEGAARAA